MDIERNWKRLVAIKKGCENEKIDIIHVDVSGILKKIGNKRLAKID